MVTATIWDAPGDCDFNHPENTKAAEFRGFSVRLLGAGEAIRTLDPNLGKVVLYP